MAWRTTRRKILISTQARTDQRAHNPQREELPRIYPAAGPTPGPDPMGRPDAQQELTELAAAGTFSRLRVAF